MAQGSKAAYSSKQKRQASEIEKSVKKRGGSSKKAARIAWATVNKQDGGAKKKTATKKAAKKKTSKKASTKKATAKKATSKKASTKKKTTAKKATKKKTSRKK